MTTRVPAKYRAKGVNAGQYTRVFDDNAKNRMSAHIAKSYSGPGIFF